MVDLTKESDSNSKSLNTYITMPERPTPYEIVPGLYANTAAYQLFAVDLVDGFAEEFPTTIRSDNFCDWPGVPGQVTSLYNIMGVGHDPAGVPPYNATEVKLAFKRLKPEAAPELDDLDAASMVVARNLAKVMLRRATPGSIPIKRQTSAGLPALSKELEYKYRVIDTWHSRWSDIIVNVKNHNLEYLEEEYGILFCYFTGRRYQPDAVQFKDGKYVPKVRIVQDWTGQWVVANRELPDMVERSKYFDRFTCCRVRKINASPLASTYLCGSQRSLVSTILMLHILILSLFEGLMIYSVGHRASRRYRCGTWRTMMS